MEGKTYKVITVFSRSVKCSVSVSEVSKSIQSQFSDGMERANIYNKLIYLI